MALNAFKRKGEEELAIPKIEDFDPWVWADKQEKEAWNHLREIQNKQDELRARVTAAQDPEAPVETIRAALGAAGEIAELELDLKIAWQAWDAKRNETHAARHRFSTEAQEKVAPLHREAIRQVALNALKTARSQTALWQFRDKVESHGIGLSTLPAMRIRGFGLLEDPNSAVSQFLDECRRVFDLEVREPQDMPRQIMPGRSLISRSD